MPQIDVIENFADENVLTQAQLHAMALSIENFLNLTKLDAENIQSGAIDASLIAEEAVTTEKISPSAVLLNKLATEVVNRLVPSGAVTAYGGDVIPNGYLLCDGSAVSRTTFSALFGAIGTKHGNGDGASTFNLPDYRGRFLRGTDANTGRDPNAADRTAMAVGGATGDAVGSVQGYSTALPVISSMTVSGTTSGQSNSHGHAITTTNFAGNGGNSKVAGSSGNTGDLVPGQTGGANADHSHTYSATVVGGDNETRPINANVNWIIKT
jgi:microcystin-dependent protein